MQYSKPHMCLTVDNFPMLPVGFRDVSLCRLLSREITFEMCSRCVFAIHPHTNSSVQKNHKARVSLWMWNVKLTRCFFSFSLPSIPLSEVRDVKFPFYSVSVIRPHVIARPHPRLIVKLLWQVSAKGFLFTYLFHITDGRQWRINMQLYPNSHWIGLFISPQSLFLFISGATAALFSSG